jgi:protein phosphatase 1 regulatory subunit 42
MKELSQVLGQWTKLTKLELMGNPLCQKYKYRDRVITMGRSIGE